MGLFPGAPEDEYSVEIERIVEQLASCESALQLAEQVQHIFQQQFGQPMERTSVMIVASKIWLSSAYWKLEVTLEE